MRVDIDILVNSAGIARHTSTVDTTEADFDDVMSVNVRSAYFLAQSAAKKMISKGVGGSIIQIFAKPSSFILNNSSNAPSFLVTSFTSFTYSGS